MDSFSNIEYIKLEAEQPFLSYSDTSHGKEPPAQTLGHQQVWRKQTTAIIAHLLCICLYTLVALGVIIYTIRPREGCKFKDSKYPDYYSMCLVSVNKFYNI